MERRIRNVDSRLETLKATIIPVMENPLLQQWVKDKVIRETVQDLSLPFICAYWVVCKYVKRGNFLGYLGVIIKKIAYNPRTLD